MRRREFITLIGAASAAWPLAAHSQQPTMSRIGMLVGLPEDDPEAEKWIQALVDGLSQLGWKRDKNIRIDIRLEDIDLARMQQLAKELIDLRPDLIQVTTTPFTAAVLGETHTIPVVFSVVSDPLGSGFVKSFARPDGNATGFVNLEDSVAGKWLELLKELAPANLSGLSAVQSENRAAIRLLPEITGGSRTVDRTQTEDRAGQQRR
jgi:putative tryptophan/tyrosine transport system substrate-binding protein